MVSQETKPLELPAPSPSYDLAVLPDVVVGSPPPEIPQADIPHDREVVLQRLLDGPWKQDYSSLNYEDAVSRGLFDIFKYDSETGRDAVVHILSGEVVTNGFAPGIPEGFHHEPSADYGPGLPGETFVDVKHLETATSDARRGYKRLPYEPYRARVVVEGQQKAGRKIDLDKGEVTFEPVRNGMYPAEYDAYMVLQAVNMAYRSRDRSKDEVSRDNGALVNTGSVPMLDGKSMMRIRLIMDPETEQVISAIPIPKEGGVMKLSQMAVEHHIFGN